MQSVPAREKRSLIAVNLRPTSLAPFRRILPDRLITDFLKSAGFAWRDRVYSPLVVFWAMTAQALDDDHSCSAAVGRVLGWLRARKAPGQRRNRRVPKASTDTGSYCRARARLPLELFPAMVRRIAQDFQGLVSAESKLWGRDIFLVDGSSVSVPDTPELVEEFGKHRGGKNRSEFPFPTARFVALISLATGAVADLAIGAFKESEHALFGKIWKAADWLRGAVVVGDSLYGSFPEIALLKARGIDLISRPYGSRGFDMRRGKRLGEGDRLVSWRRGEKRPAWLAADDDLPESLQVRLIEVKPLRRGHRPKRLVLVTTLLDPALYPAEEIAGLYLRRWDIEVDLRHLKSTMEMDVPGGKSPDIVRKEIWSFMAAYNLIRRVMWESGVSRDFPPSGLEFQRDAPTRAYLAWANRVLPEFTIGDEALVTVA